jgi:hypothetical protein
VLHLFFDLHYRKILSATSLNIVFATTIMQFCIMFFGDMHHVKKLFATTIL